MKILIISLLRIGDIVMMAPALRGLREKHPEAEIHLLINSQFKQVAALLPYIDRVLVFERDKIQKGLGDAAVPIFESYERLNDAVDEINAESYDWAINLTHNRLSGWIMSLMEAKTKTGLALDAQGRATFGSNWFRYLNTQVEADGSEVFHFSDVFRFALGIEEHARNSLAESASGRAEAEAFVSGVSAKGLITVQALTSDKKKDWGLERFTETLERVQRVNPDAAFAILGAPFERERLQPMVTELTSRGVNAHLAILSFEGAFSLLKLSKLLLTVDTSIKHLASAARTPIVEVSLGSSDAHRTGAYLHGSVIIQSREACAPCPHSRPCHRESHACAVGLSAEVVAMVTSEVYSGRSFQLEMIAEEYKSEVEILKVESSVGGFRAAYSLVESFSEASIGRWVDLACRKIWLDSTGRSNDRMGTETLRLARFFKAIHTNTSEIEWRHLLGDFEKQAELVEGRINGFKVGLQYLRGCYEDPKRVREFTRGLIALRERIRHLPLLSSFKASLDEVIEDDISPAFTRYRRMTDLVSEIERRTDIYLRLIRGLMQTSDGEKGLEKI